LGSGNPTETSGNGETKRRRNGSFPTCRMIRSHGERPHPTPRQTIDRQRRRPVVASLLAQLRLLRRTLEVPHLGHYPQQLRVVEDLVRRATAPNNSHSSGNQALGPSRSSPDPVHRELRGQPKGLLARYHLGKPRAWCLTMTPRRPGLLQPAPHRRDAASLANITRTTFAAVPVAARRRADHCHGRHKGD